MIGVVLALILACACALCVCKCRRWRRRRRARDARHKRRQRRRRRQRQRADAGGSAEDEEERSSSEEEHSPSSSPNRPGRVVVAHSRRPLPRAVRPPARAAPPRLPAASGTDGLGGLSREAVEMLAAHWAAELELPEGGCITPPPDRAWTRAPQPALHSVPGHEPSPASTAPRAVGWPGGACVGAALAGRPGCAGWCAAREAACGGCAPSRRLHALPSTEAPPRCPSRPRPQFAPRAGLQAAPPVAACAPVRPHAESHERHVPRPRHGSDGMGPSQPHQPPQLGSRGAESRAVAMQAARQAIADQLGHAADQV